MRATVWLTLGDAPDTVQLWLVRPVLVDGRWELPAGAAHLVAAEQGQVSAKFTVWSREVTLAEFRVAPDTQRECVRIDGAGELTAAQPR